MAAHKAGAALSTTSGALSPQDTGRFNKLCPSAAILPRSVPRGFFTSIYRGLFFAIFMLVFKLCPVLIKLRYMINGDR
jgi:hypothetical protein